MRAKVRLHVGDLIEHQTLIDMGPEKGLAYLRSVVDQLRLEARDEIRRRSRGRYPHPGPADEPVQMESMG